MGLHKKIAKAFGYELIRRRKHTTLNTHIINIINHHKVNLVLDVGANVGDFGKMLRAEGYYGIIHSFEPVSQTFNQLRKTSFNDQKWFVHKMAMGEVCGKEIINITESSNLSSFLNPNDFGKEYSKTINILQKEMVEVETIDNFLNTQISDFDNLRILLKIDTQGYDLKVFKGAINTIKHIICILSELCIKPIYSGMPHYLDSLRIYEKYGFIISGIYPICRDEDMSLVEMDCMLINNQNT